MVSEVEVLVVVTIIVVMLVVEFAGLRITNFNSRERVTAKIAKTIREMPMIQRHCRNLYRTLFPVLLSIYAWLLCILCFTRNFSLKQKIDSVGDYFIFVFDYQNSDKVQGTLCRTQQTVGILLSLYDIDYM